jgi:hypothetical protein
MVTERVLVAIKGGKQRRGKKWGVGEEKHIVAIERFLVATNGFVGIFGHHLELSNGDRICLSHLMATNFGKGFLKVYEFLNTIHDSFFNTFILIWVLCL